MKPTPASLNFALTPALIYRSRGTSWRLGRAASSAKARADRVFVLLAYLLIATALPAFGALPPATVVDTSTCIPLPADAAWNLAINFRPTSNEVVNFNPPLFTWCYAPGGGSTIASDTQQYNFVFQVENDNSFTDPVVNLVTSCNFYNFLAPLANTSGTIYWRVGYISATSNTTNAWVTNSFQISSTATNWDRSSFLTLANARAVHPYILINNSNAFSIRNWLSTNTISWVNAEWKQCQTDASNCWSQSWYTNGFTDWKDSSAAVLGGHYLTDAAFMWRLTTNSYWTNQNPTPMYVLTNYANWIITNQYDQKDDVLAWDPFPEVVPQFGFLYDWYYDAMDAGQRQMLLRLIDYYSLFILHGYNWAADSGSSVTYYPGTNRTYPAPYQVYYGSDFKAGQSHQHQVFETRYPLILAGFNDDVNVSNAWVMGCNYYLAVGFYDGHDGGPHEPRDYNQTAMYGPGAVGLMTWLNAMLTGAVFPEGQIGNNPFFHRTAQFTQAFTPVQFYELNDPWADGAESSMRNVNAYGEGFSKALGMMSMLTGDGMVQSHFATQNALTGEASTANFTYKPYHFLLPYWFPPPTPVTNNTLAYCFPEDGWVEAASLPANQASCFSNGVGIIFKASPSGKLSGSHTTSCDGEFQIWAYGTDLTDSGEFYNDYQARYGETSWSHYTPTIDGVGQLQNPDAPTTSWYSRIMAFANASDYVFWAADLTKAYPVDQRSGQDYSGGGPHGIWPAPYIQIATANVFSDVHAVQRYILFNHHKYFVIYDSFSSASNHTWSEPYHIMENTLTNDYGATFTYTCTNQITGAGTRVVTNFVFQCVNSNLLAVTNMTGANVKANPITGENYYSLTPGDPYVRTTAKWVSSAQATNNFHLLTVIYPVPPGGTLPIIQRIDDYTVAVTNGGQGDVISFDPNTTNAPTFLVNLPAISATAGVDTNIYSSGSTSPSGGGGGGGSPAPPLAIPSPTNFRFLTNSTASSFAPIPGYYAWFNADTLTGSNNTPVSSWVDSSPNAFAATQGNLTNQPMLEVQGQNGHNYLTFNGSSSFLQWVTGTAITGPMEIFIVEQEAAPCGGGMLLVNNSSVSDANFLRIEDFGGSFSLHLALTRSGTDFVTTKSCASTNWLVVTALINGASTQIFTNGLVAASGTMNNSVYLRGANFGGNPALASFQNGQTAEIIIYTNVLSTANQQIVENGLRAKYGF